MSEDNVVILNQGDDEDSTIFQTTQDREKLLKDILGDEEEDSQLDTTFNMIPAVSPPYWQQLFG